MKWLANLKPFPKKLRIHCPPCTFFCWQFQLNVRVLSAPVVCCGEDQGTKAVPKLSALLLIWNEGVCECVRCGHFWIWIYRYNHVFQLGGTNSRLLHMEFPLTCQIICYVLSHLAPTLLCCIDAIVPCYRAQAFPPPQCTEVWRVPDSTMSLSRAQWQPCHSPLKLLLFGTSWNLSSMWAFWGISKHS